MHWARRGATLCGLVLTVGHSTPSPQCLTPFHKGPFGICRVRNLNPGCIHGVAIAWFSPLSLFRLHRDLVSLSHGASVCAQVSDEHFTVHVEPLLVAKLSWRAFRVRVNSLMCRARFPAFLY